MVEIVRRCWQDLRQRSVVTEPGWVRGVITEYCNYQTIRLVGYGDSASVHVDVVVVVCWGREW